MDLQYPQAHPNWFPATAGGLDVDAHQWPPTPTQGFTPAYQLQPPFMNGTPGFAPYEPFTAGDARPETMPDERSYKWQHYQKFHGQPADPLNNLGHQLD